MESFSCFNVLSPRILRILLPAMALLSFLVQQTSASFNNTKGWQSYNSTMTDAYLGYSNNPWGPSTLLAGATSNRPKRSVVHLYNMVLCATGCNPLSYKGYGCYCGFLGSGYPTDPIDRCCKMHDWCYNAANCPMFLEYFVPYVWTCYRRRPLCGVGTSCAQRLCECDRKLAECLARYPCPRTRAVCTSSPWRLFQNLIML